MIGSSPWTIEVLLDELKVLHSRVHALRRGSDALTGDLIDLAELEIN